MSARSRRWSRRWSDAGTQTTAWVAYGGYAENLRYWCHGLSLGTYESDGYSVWSGGPLKPNSLTNRARRGKRAHRVGKSETSPWYQPK